MNILKPQRTSIVLAFFFFLLTQINAQTKVHLSSKKVTMQFLNRDELTAVLIGDSIASLKGNICFLLTSTDTLYCNTIAFPDKHIEASGNVRLYNALGTKIYSDKLIIEIDELKDSEVPKIK